MTRRQLDALEKRVNQVIEDTRETVGVVIYDRETGVKLSAGPEPECGGVVVYLPHNGRDEVRA